MDNNNKPTSNSNKRSIQLANDGKDGFHIGAQDTLLGKEGWGGSFYYADPSLYGLLKQYARENRKNMTETESILWRYIRRDALGVTFLRQFIIGEYIVDFVCLKPKIIIEVDGGYHSEPRKQQDDQVRQQWLESQGFKVLRLKNEEIIGDIDGVVDKIMSKSNLSLPVNKNI